MSTSTPSSFAYLRMLSSYSGSVIGPNTSTCTLPRMFMPQPCITRILSIAIYSRLFERWIIDHDRRRCAMASSTKTIQIRMGGYGPPTTTCSRGLKIMGDRLEAELGDAVDVKYIWNVMDFGYKGGDLLWMTEHGILTLSYQSTSYLADRVPELDLADLPFLFEGLDQPRAAMDGKL